MQGNEKSTGASGNGKKSTSKVKASALETLSHRPSCLPPAMTCSLSVDQEGPFSALTWSFAYGLRGTWTLCQLFGPMTLPRATAPPTGDRTHPSIILSLDFFGETRETLDEKNFICHTDVV